MLTSATSAPFAVNAGGVASYELTAANASMALGDANLITIQPRDAFGNATVGSPSVTIRGRNETNTADDTDVEVDANRNGFYGDATVNTTGGATTFNIRNNQPGTFTVRADDGLATGLSGTITADTPTSPIVISEFRFRGPAGIGDEYVVISNTTAAPITVSTSDGSTGWGLVGADGVLRVTIPNGTILPPRGAYLITNNGANGFSLSTYPAGAGTVGSGDAQYALDISSSGASAGIALFRSNLTFDLTTRIDAVGYSTVNALYREGTGMATGGAEQVVNLQQAYIRNLAGGGIPKDTATTRPTSVRWTPTGRSRAMANASACPARAAAGLSSATSPACHRRCVTAEPMTGTFPVAA